MKLISVLIICVIGLQDEFNLEKKTVGSLKVGMDVTEIYYLFEKDVETTLIDRYEEATFSPAIEVTKEGEILFVANINCSSIRSFEIYSNRYRTITGLSVGSSLAKLKAKHTLSIDMREGNLSVVDKENGMVFLLEQTQKIRSLNTIKVTLGDIPEEAKITSIIIY